MRKTTLVLLISSLALGACGSAQGSRLNPFNWFGGDQAEAPAPASTNPLIPKTREGLFSSSDDKDAYLGTPVDQITDLVIEAVPGGAIIRASGTAQGSALYDVQLTPDADGPQDGVLSLRLEARKRPGLPSGEVTAALRLSDRQLAGVRIIRVSALQNMLASRL
jgi:hypothetical protein